MVLDTFCLPNLSKCGWMMMIHTRTWWLIYKRWHFYLQCFLKPMCLILIARGDRGTGGGSLLFAVLILLVWVFFPQMKHFSVICSHFQYYQVLENITFSWGDSWGCNCLFIQALLQLPQAHLHHTHLCGKKISQITPQFGLEKEVCLAVNP